MPSENKGFVSIKFKPEDLETLKRLAAEQERSVSYVVRKAAEAWMTNQLLKVAPKPRTVGASPLSFDEDDAA